MSATLVEGMLLPRIVAANGVDADTGNPYGDPTYYDPVTELLVESGSPIEVLTGDGTFYPAPTDFDVHLNRAWRTRGFLSARIQGSAIIVPSGFNIDLSTVTADFDETFTRSSPSAISQRQILDATGTPSRSYAYGSQPFRRIKILPTDPDRGLITVNGFNSVGNVGGSPSIDFNWFLPTALDPLSETQWGTAEDLTTVYVYEYMSGSPASPAYSTPMDAKAYVIAFGSSLVPVLGYPIIFYLGIRVDFFARDLSGLSFTHPRFWFADVTGGDSSPLEDANSTGYFGSVLVESAACDDACTVLDTSLGGGGAVSVHGSPATYTFPNYTSSVSSGFTLTLTDELQFT